MMTDIIREIKYETFEKQHEIIRLQSSAINDLVSMLMQHGLDDGDFAEVKEKIDLAAQIRAEI